MLFPSKYSYTCHFLEFLDAPCPLLYVPSVIPNIETAPQNPIDRRVSFVILPCRSFASMAEADARAERAAVSPDPNSLSARSLTGNERRLRLTEFELLAAGMQFSDDRIWASNLAPNSLSSLPLCTAAFLRFL